MLSVDGDGYERHRDANLQFTRAREGKLAFELPPSSPDFGERVAACCDGVFPKLMLNFYPWGLSVNIVQPQAPRHKEFELDRKTPPPFVESAGKRPKTRK